MSEPARDRHVLVGHRGGTVEAGVHHDDLGALLLRFDGPLEAHRVRFGRVAAHDQDEVGVLDVHPGIGHGAATKGGGQCGHRRAVADPGLGVGTDDAQERMNFWVRMPVSLEEAEAVSMAVESQRSTVTPSAFFLAMKLASRSASCAWQRARWPHARRCASTPCCPAPALRGASGGWGCG